METRTLKKKTISITLLVVSNAIFIRISYDYFFSLKHISKVRASRRLLKMENASFLKMKIKL